MQAAEFPHKIAPSAEFLFGGDILLEKRNYFGSDGATALARSCAKGFVEFIGYVFHV
jgi:hypothetical protein